MKGTVFGKILENHIISGEIEPGKEAGIKIDQTLTQDATGTMAYLEFEAMEIPEIKTDLSVSYVDHNTTQIGYENADDHRYLQSIAAKYGIYFSRPGNGICHQVHLERFGKPGTTMLGSDSHTPTGGGIGMIAIGAGGLDVALSLSGREFIFTIPKIIKVNLKNKLKDWVTAKDIILYILSILGTKGNVGYVLEYGGDISSLSVPERATITNMGAELGVTTSIFPADNITREFLISQGRENDFTEILADKDAEYERIIDIDLSELEPMIACPHSPGNVKKISELIGMKVDQICIGSCTNSSYTDLMSVANILKGRKINDNVSLIISHGSRQVMKMMAKNGSLTTFIEAGARIGESVCGFCIGNSYSPKTNGISLRTINRNFYGRSGTLSANVYLVSPEIASLAAIFGEIVNPIESGILYKRFNIPERYSIDDTMVIPPLPINKRKKIKIYRGPNIGSPPKNTPLDNIIHGVVAIKVGDKITTDHIMPAGSKLKFRSNIPEYSKYVFESIDPTFSQRALNNKNKRIANIIIAGESYGQGSSREHAAICPMYLGVKIVLAKSFERIHKANLINFGILPLLFKNPMDYNSIKEGASVICDNIRKKIIDSNFIKIDINGKLIEAEIDLSTMSREVILSGGMLNYIAKNN